MGVCFSLPAEEPARPTGAPSAPAAAGGGAPHQNGAASASACRKPGGDGGAPQPAAAQQAAHPGLHDPLPAAAAAALSAAAASSAAMLARAPPPPGADLGAHPYINHLRRRSTREGEAATRIGSLTLTRISLTPAKAQVQLQLLDDAHNLQRELASVSDNPLLGLQEAAELLHYHLGVDLAA
jgi:hypothetical protein